MLYLHRSYDKSGAGSSRLRRKFRNSHNPKRPDASRSENHPRPALPLVFQRPLHPRTNFLLQTRATLDDRLLGLSPLGVGRLGAGFWCLSGLGCLVAF